jgi:hypothetical protein
MAKKRGGLAGIYDRNKKIFNPAANIASLATGGPLSLYNNRLLTQEGGGLKKVVNDPLYQAQAATLAGGLAAPALSGGAAAGGMAGGGSTAAGGGAGGGGGAGMFTGLGKVFGKGGVVSQNLPLIQGIGKGIMGVRQGALDQQAADATLNQRKYEFDKTYALDAAKEADRKRREDDLMAQRAAFRAMFTGTA